MEASLVPQKVAHKELQSETLASWSRQGDRLQAQDRRLSHQHDRQSLPRVRLSKCRPSCDKEAMTDTILGHSFLKTRVGSTRTIQRSSWSKIRAAQTSNSRLCSPCSRDVRQLHGPSASKQSTWSCASEKPSTLCANWLASLWMRYTARCCKLSSMTSYLRLRCLPSTGTSLMRASMSIALRARAHTIATWPWYLSGRLMRPFSAARLS